MMINYCRLLVMRGMLTASVTRAIVVGPHGTARLGPLPSALPCRPGPAAQCAVCASLQKCAPAPFRRDPVRARTATLPPLRHQVRPINLRNEEYIQMSEVFDLFVFDFNEAKVEQAVEEMDIIISKDGIVSALVLWFDLILDEEIVVSTSPFGEPERTLQMGQGIVYLQPSECRVKRGSTVPFVAATNGSELAFTINEEKLTKSGMVDPTGATRFDPRWEGARANLEDAWKKILTNLSYNPKEFKVMTDAIMRLSAQPAAFGIDQIVAERCALTFLAE